MDSEKLMPIRLRKLIGAVALILLVTIWALLAIVAIAGITLGVSREHRSATGKVRIVVLPFDNLSHDPEQEFFSDGLAEEMIAELGRVAPQRLGVIAQTSSARYKRSGKSISEIGKELNVDYVLEGSVRRDGKQMHVTSQLIKASDQTQVWADSYDRPVNDTFRLESELTDRVANALALNPRATSAEVRLIPATQNSEAHEEYLRGRYELNRMRTWRRHLTSIRSSLWPMQRCRTLTAWNPGGAT